jgi:hypothetical protein
MGKTLVVYERENDPTLAWVYNIVIQAETVPPYVWSVYGEFDRLPILGPDMPLVSRRAAFNLFEFRPGRIADCRRPE